MRGGRRSRSLKLAAALLPIVGLAVSLVLWFEARPESALIAEAAFPAAMAPLPDGGLVYGERLTGRIRRIDLRGRRAAREVARVEVSSGGQRGLLGLAVLGRAKVFAAWTRPDKRIVVGSVAPGPERLVWLGPESSNLGNGGHLTTSPDGALVIGIGDLRQPSRIVDPLAPNGKLLRLDPSGSPDQQPAVISAGWNNPFAFTFTPEGNLWVADNSPGKAPERLARGDLGRGPSRVTELRQETAPSGLAAIDERRLALCGFQSSDIRVFRIGRDGLAAPAGGPLVRDRSIGVVRLADGRLAYANETSIRALRL